MGLYKMDEKIRLPWHTFTEHFNSVFYDLLTTRNFADVILVCDDLKKFRAHKFILQACSAVFKTLLEEENSNAVIYLKGIKHQEMEQILFFMYRGEAEVAQKRIQEFFSVAKSLGVKGVENRLDDSQMNQNDESIICNDIKEEYELENPNVKNSSVDGTNEATDDVNHLVNESNTNKSKIETETKSSSGVDLWNKIIEECFNEELSDVDIKEKPKTLTCTECGHTV